MKTRLSIASLVLFAAAACSEAPATGPAPDEVAGVAASASASAASHVPFVQTLCVVNETLTSPPRFTDGILHLHGGAIVNEVTLHGDIEGEGVGVWNADLHAATGTGPIRGAFQFEVTELFGQPVDGGIDGTAHGRSDGPTFEGKAVGHGTGDLQGMKFRYRFDDVGHPGVFDQYGVVTDPAGALSEPATHDSGECPAT